MPPTVVSIVFLVLVPVFGYYLPGSSPSDAKDKASDIPMRTLITDPAVLLLFSVIALGYGSIAFLDPVLAPHLESSLGVSVAQVGLIFVVPCFVYGVGAPISGFAADKSGPFTTMAAGLLLLALSLMLLAPFPRSIPLTVGSQIIALVGLGGLSVAPRCLTRSMYWRVAQSVLGLGAAMALIPAMPGVMLVASKYSPTGSTSEGMGVRGGSLWWRWSTEQLSPLTGLVCCAECISAVVGGAVCW